MENMTETKARFIRENPRAEMKFETVQTEYLKWLEDLARKQLAYNDALQIVSKTYSEKDMDMAYDKGYSDGQDTRAI
jgi:aspartyl/asparaginyl-tRNA synthetase